MVLVTNIAGHDIVESNPETVRLVVFMCLLHFGSKAHDRYMAGQFAHPWTTNYLVNKPADEWAAFEDDPFGFLRLFLHSFGAATFSDLTGMLPWVLLWGPTLEDYYGPLQMWCSYLGTALVSGIVFTTAGQPGQTQQGSGDILCMTALMALYIALKEKTVSLNLLIAKGMWMANTVFRPLIFTDKANEGLDLSVPVGAIGGIYIGFWCQQNEALVNKLTAPLFACCKMLKSGSAKID